jgi:hypothetical protein
MVSPPSEMLPPLRLRLLLAVKAQVQARGCSSALYWTGAAGVGEAGALTCVRAAPAKPMGLMWSNLSKTTT